MIDIVKAKNERYIPDALFYVLIALLVLSLSINLYLFSNPRKVEIPVVYDVAPDRIIDKELLLNYNERAGIVCAYNGLGDGFIYIDKNRSDVYILCFSNNTITRELNLIDAEIFGSPSLVR